MLADVSRIAKILRNPQVRIEDTSPEEGGDSSPIVLIADDEAPIRELVSAVLAAAGLEVLVAEDGSAALAAAKRLGRPVDLLITDVAMPGMDGLTLATSLMNLSPRTRVLLMSGYSSALGKAKASNWRFLAKPFRVDRLIAEVHASLSGRPESQKESA